MVSKMGFSPEEAARGEFFSFSLGVRSYWQVFGFKILLFLKTRFKPPI